MVAISRNSISNDYCSGGVDKKLMLQALFPTTFSVNWYITAYIIFYPLHGVLNKAIYNMTQRQLLTLSSVASVLYILCGVWNDQLFFSSTLILWCTVYFIVAYLKLYCVSLCNNVRISSCFSITVSFLHLILLVSTNYLGLRYTRFSRMLLRWNGLCNPILIVGAISLFNFFRLFRCKNSIINRISSYTLLIYAIHENLMIRSYLRPVIWLAIYENFGYDLILLWCIICSLALFCASLGLGMIFRLLACKVVNRLVDKVERCLSIFQSKWENIVTKIQ